MRSTHTNTRLPSRAVSPSRCALTIEPCGTSDVATWLGRAAPGSGLLYPCTQNASAHTLRAQSFHDIAVELHRTRVLCNTSSASTTRGRRDPFAAGCVADHEKRLSAPCSHTVHLQSRIDQCWTSSRCTSTHHFRTLQVVGAAAGRTDVSILDCSPSGDWYGLFCAEEPLVEPTLTSTLPAAATPAQVTRQRGPARLGRRA